jgi:hypothetical protein
MLNSQLSPCQFNEVSHRIHKTSVDQALTGLSLGFHVREQLVLNLEPVVKVKDEIYHDPPRAFESAVEGNHTSC